MKAEVQGITIRDAQPEEYAALGALTAARFAALEGFPSPEEQPEYYATLRDVTLRVTHPSVRNLVAMRGDIVLGGVTFVGDMAHYGAPGGNAHHEQHAAGMRLLAVAPEASGQGIGRALTLECIRLARASGQATLILHSTRAMPAAWKLYESLGFQRATDLDFMQGTLLVEGFRLPLAPATDLRLAS